MTIGMIFLGVILLGLGLYLLYALLNPEQF